MTKKLMSVLLAVAMCLSLAAPAVAVEDHGFTDKETTKQEQNFLVSETVDAEQRIIRTFERPNTASLFVNTDSSKYDYEAVRNTLLALGMPAETVSQFPDETLDIYAAAPLIQTVTTYFKEDAEGHVSIVSEEEALCAVNAVPSGNVSVAGVVENGDENEDSYMKLVFGVANSADVPEAIHFSVDATWLKMPAFRLTDVIGACAQLCTVTPGTQCGYYEYTKQHYTKDQFGAICSEYEIPEKYDFTSSDFKTVTDGTFYGAAAKIVLKSDSFGSMEETYYRDYHIFFAYDGHVNLPDQRMYINTTGTYIHTQIVPTINPSLTIRVNGATGAIGITNATVSEYRDVPLEVVYNP